MARVSEILEQVHTFLVHEGSWDVNGTFMDERGIIIDASGQIIITHKPEGWIIDSSMTLALPQPVTIINRYEIMPFDPAKETITFWTSLNPSLGQMRGSFVLVADAILSVYQSTDGHYQGTECLVQQSNSSYISYAALFKGNTLISRWYMGLRASTS